LQLQANEFSPETTTTALSTTGTNELSTPTSWRARRQQNVGHQPGFDAKATDSEAGCLLQIVEKQQSQMLEMQRQLQSLYSLMGNVLQTKENSFIKEAAPYSTTSTTQTEGHSAAAQQTPAPGSPRVRTCKLQARIACAEHVPEHPLCRDVASTVGASLEAMSLPQRCHSAAQTGSTDAQTLTHNKPSSSRSGSPSLAAPRTKDSNLVCSSVASMASSQASELILGLPEGESEEAAAVSIPVTAEPLPISLGISLQDSADTAGGTTPRRLHRADGGIDDIRVSEGIPRIVCPSNSSSFSELVDLEDVASSSEFSNIGGLCASLSTGFTLGVGGVLGTTPFTSQPPRAWG
jgi:hypothetical protein